MPLLQPVREAIQLYLDANPWGVSRDLPTPASLGADTMVSCCKVFQATRGADVGCSSGPIGTVTGTIMGARIVLDPDQPSCTSPKR